MPCKPESGDMTLTIIVEREFNVISASCKGFAVNKMCLWSDYMKIPQLHIVNM